MDQRKTMGESQTRSLALGRLSALAFGCAAVLASPVAMAQARSPAGDKAGARSLSGTVVQFEENPGRAILYHEAQGGLLGNGSSPTARANGASAAAPKTDRKSTR